MLNKYEILFKDSPEYFYIENARMIQEGQMIRFLIYNKDGKYKEDHFYPITNIHRIKKINDDNS